ncbi:rhomboid family intramembrane serine protease [bacterium]|nr:rhomboid family intramembrane serine protease [bacterium]
MSTEPSPSEAGVTYKPPFLTFVLIAVNTLIYAMIQFQGGPTYENLVKYGAKENGLIAEGEFGRLFFPMFLHASPAHILFNMFALYQFGRVFEVLAGARNLFVTYVLGGLLGNAMSFALSKSLSVGASSSLFALLFALYVFERYQQKINLETTGIKTRTALGPVIAINAVITFVIPNIDWASHLGGGIAGVLIGTGLIMKHKINVRMMSMVKYWRVDPATLQLRFYQREGFYLGVVAALVLLSLIKVPQVSFADRVFGLGVLDASRSSMEGHADDELTAYRSSFDDPTSPANPETLLQLSLSHLLAGRYDAAVPVLSALRRLNQHGLGSAEFASKSTLALLEQASESALSRRPLDSSLVKLLTGEEHAVAADLSHCQKAADYVHGLGFYAISGLLYECAFFLDVGNKELARAGIADLWLESRRCEEQPISPPHDENVNPYQWTRSQRNACLLELDVFRSQLLRLERQGRLDVHGTPVDDAATNLGPQR